MAIPAQYDKPLYMSYRFPAASLAATGVVGRVIGPIGKQGRLRSFTGIVTTTLTTTPPVIQFGTAGTPTLVFSKTVALAAANSGFQLTSAEEDATQPRTKHLPADTVAQLNVSVAAAAGAADLNLGIDWY